MVRLVAVLFALLAAASPVVAQDTTSGDVSSATSETVGNMKALLAAGYEIKAAVANGTNYIVFLQKEKSAVACEFVKLTSSRCGTIN